MIAGLLGMTAAADLFNFFAFWELMSAWALWAAIVHEETAVARREGFKYFLFNTIGASLLYPWRHDGRCPKRHFPPGRFG